MNKLVSLIGTLFLWVHATSAAAQVVAGPPGSSGGLFGGHRPVDPNSVSQRLFLTVDLGGGYDSQADTQVVGDPVAEFQAQRAGTAEVDARYWRGKPNSFFEVAGNGHVNYETSAQQQLIGGEALLQGSTGIGPRLQLTGGVLVSYDPAAISTQFAPGLGQQDPGLPVDHSPPIGIMDEPWLASSSYLNALRTWSVRQSTVLEYRASRRDPLDGPGIANWGQEASVMHSWNFHQSAGFRVSYRFDDNRQSTETTILQPLRTSTLDAGVRFDRRFSPVRVLSLEVAGGAVQANRPALLETRALDYTLPVMSGSIRFNFTGVWSVMVEGNREITVLEGVSPEPFATTAGTLQLHATLSHRLVVAVSGVYSKGDGLETGSEAFDTAQAQAQFQYGFARCCGTFGSYSFYQHHTRDLASLPLNYPERYSRHAMRVGVTFWLPLYGSF